MSYPQSVHSQIIKAETSKLMQTADSDFKQKQKKTAKKNQQLKIIKEKFKKVTNLIDSILFGKQSE